MSTQTLLVQLRSLEAQLAILRAHLKQTGPIRKPFAAFYGILGGMADTTAEEVESAKLKIKIELT